MIAWKKSNRDKVSLHNLKQKRILKGKAYTLLGNKCSNPMCRWQNEDGSLGCTDRRCLQIDHINNDGNVDRKKSAYCTQRLYIDITKGSTKYQLLCANCNWLKRKDLKSVKY